MIILFGPAGVGKSTQGSLLTERYGWHWLSTGEILRQSTDPEVMATLKAGELVSDEQAYEVLDSALNELEDDANVVLDGFPRTAAQAQWLIEYATTHRHKIDTVLVIDVPTDELVARLAERGRPEDAPEAVRRRMDIYHNKLDAILAVFKESNTPVAHVDGLGDVQAVHQRMVTQLEERQIAS